MIFHYPMDKRQKMPLYMQLYRNLRKNIREGELAAGQRLPAIREMREIAGLSRTTVENAYQQLLMEGYIESRQKVGYFVLPLKIAEPPGPVMEVREEERSYLRKQTNMINTGVDPDGFDFGLWRKLHAQVLREESHSLLNAGDATGEMALKLQLREQLRRDRGVNCMPAQIVIGAGVQVLLGMLLPLLPQNPRRVGVEDPGFVKAQFVFEDYGWQPVKIPLVDGGMDVDRLQASDSRIAYVSPSHQYPTGTVMPVAKREALLRWAEEESGLIIEDDYDSYLRYSGNPIPALQGMDRNDRVIYLGSLSKLLLPSLRISYMILPRSMVQTFENNKRRMTPSASKIDQLTLARLMKEGHYERHLRRIRKIYRKKNQLLNEFFSHAQDWVKVLGTESGVHLILDVQKPVQMSTLIQMARNRGIYLETIATNDKFKQQLLFPYSGIPYAEIPEVCMELLQMMKGSESDEGTFGSVESSGNW